MTYDSWPWTDWQRGAPWDGWTWRRGLAAAAIILISTGGSLMLAAESISVSWCDFMNLECTPAELRRVDRLRVAAVVVFPLGPLVVFVLRRRMVWILTPPALLAVLAASFYFL